MSENNMPTSFEESLTQAELSCFAFLCDRLGLQPARNAFLSVRDEGIVDCIVFDIGSMENGGQATYNAQHYHWRAQCDIYSRDRNAVQKSIMRMLQHFPVDQVYNSDHPLRKTGNVECFRIAPITGSIGAIATKELEVKIGTKPVPVFVCTVLFDVVFRAGARPVA